MADSLFFLLLGSNQGDRLDQLVNAAVKIECLIGRISASSSVYQTEPWGNRHQPFFLNQALKVQSQLTPTEALRMIQCIELEMGRTRLAKWGARTIDIDILYWGDHIINLPKLKIPHPEIQHRKFTLMAMAEIAPDFIHPILKNTNQQLLVACKDDLTVTRFTN